MSPAALMFAIAAILLVAGRLSATSPETAQSKRTSTATKTYSMDDLRNIISEGLLKKQPRIVIPPGLYRGGLEGGHKVHLTISDASNVEIVADGVTMICTDFTRAISFANCKTVTLQGLTVDYDPLPYTQGDVIAVNLDEGWLDVHIHAGYPVRAQSRIDICDRKTRFRRHNKPFMWNSKAEVRPDNIVRVFNKEAAGFANVGDLASLGSNLKYAVPHTICMANCDGMTLRSVTVYSSNCMGIIAAGGEGGHHIDRCRVVPGPPPSGASEARILSTNADAILTGPMRKGVITENCEIRDAGDDSWSVQSGDYVIVKKEGKTLYLAPRGTMAIEKGDRLRASLGTAPFVVKTLAKVPLENAALAPEILVKLKGARSGYWKLLGQSGKPKLARVVMETEVPWNLEESVRDIDRQGDGFVLRNNKIHSSGRILIKASGLIDGNLFENGKGIIVRPEIPYPAAVAIEEIAIRNNTIVDAHMHNPSARRAQVGAICVAAEGPDKTLRPAGIFGRVLIENNTIRGGNGAALVITSTREVRVSGNSFIAPLHVPPHESGINFGVDNHALTWFSNCDHVTLERNTVSNPGPLMSALVVRGPHSGEINGNIENSP